MKNKKESSEYFIIEYDDRLQRYEIKAKRRGEASISVLITTRRETLIDLNNLITTFLESINDNTDR